MSQVSRVPIVLSGAPVVGGGVTVLHCTVGGEHDLMTAFRAMIVSTGGNFPNSLTWTFPGAGPILNQESGELEGAWSDGSPPSSVAGLSATTWVNGVGLRVKWTTGAFYHGHAVTGATFMVPLQTGAYEGANNIVEVNRGQFVSAAATFVSAAGLRIYSRPSAEGPGQSFAVNGSQVPDKVSWLRGRRS